VNEEKRMSRRRFLWAAGGVMAASMLACGGSLAVVARPTPALDFGKTQCGKENKVSRVLVAYASRYGSPAEVAQAIGQELCSRGKIDPKQLNLVERLMFKASKSPEGDLRNWQAIRSWADQVALQGQTPQSADI
jgi:hypothetical protein